ncbi:MAG: cytochrome c [Candidatus Thiodiazotropha sp.]
MKKTNLGFALGLLLIASGSTVSAGPSAEMLAYTCAGCHGTDGSSVGPSSPHIAGMNPEYFVDSMKAYRSDERNPTIMNRIAKGYTDEQIDAMAEFFAKQKAQLANQEFDPGKAKQGAELHETYCEKCHEDGGREASDGGTLAGQWKPYLEYSMADFRSGHREMTKKMRRKLEKMEKEHGAESIDAVINFYSSQK